MFGGGEPDQGQSIADRPLEPLRYVVHFNGDHGSLVLLIGTQFGIWFVHAAHEGVRICVLGQHRVALDDFPRRPVDPAIPESGQ